MKRILSLALFLALGMDISWSQGTIGGGTLSVNVTSAGAGTLTAPYKDYIVGGITRMRVLTLDWLSNTTGTLTATLPELHGSLYRVTTKPDDGATSPTADYDVTFSDEDSYDLLLGLGANRSASTVQSLAPIFGDGTNKAFPVVFGGITTLSVAAAGAANGGIIRLYIKLED